MIITIEGSFPTINEFIDANRVLVSKGKRGTWSKGNSMKQRDQRIIAAQLPRVRLRYPVRLVYHYYEKSRRRDQDNVAGYFRKVFQDALVQAGLLPGDGWKYIDGCAEEFHVDRTRPHIEIEVIQIGG